MCYSACLFGVAFHTLCVCGCVFVLLCTCLPFFLSVKSRVLCLVSICVTLVCPSVFFSLMLCAGLALMPKAHAASSHAVVWASVCPRRACACKATTTRLDSARNGANVLTSVMRDGKVSVCGSGG